MSTEASEVRVDYKSSVKTGGVSVKRLRSLIGQVEMDITRLTLNVAIVKCELEAIIEELGEEF